MSDTRLLQDPYLDWVKDEGIPVYEDFGFDLRTLDLKPWSRVGVNAAFAFTRGRGDYLDCVVLEIPSGKSTEPQQHMYEEVVYVIDGHGSTTIDRGNGKRHSFEWGPKSLFAIPLNAKYRHFNTSGTAPARMVSTTNLPMILKLFRDTEFIFNNPYEFVGRMGEDRFFEGEGDFIPMRPGKHMWETNFVPDLSTFELKEWKDRGAGGSNIMFALAQGTMHAHMSEMPVGTYKKGHRHGADFHIFPVTGSGYSIFIFNLLSAFIKTHVHTYKRIALVFTKGIPKAAKSHRKISRRLRTSIKVLVKHHVLRSIDTAVLPIKPLEILISFKPEDRIP